MLLHINREISGVGDHALMANFIGRSAADKVGPCDARRAVAQVINHVIANCIEGRINWPGSFRRFRTLRFQDV